MEARKARTCSVVVSAANGAKALQCKEVLAKTPKSSRRPCTDAAQCDRGEACLSDGAQNVCVHLAGQTLECASDLDCTGGTRCVLGEDGASGKCTRDACGSACDAGSVCAPVFAHDTAMDEFIPNGTAQTSEFHEDGLRCMPAAASTFDAQSPPSGMCHVSIRTQCEIVDGDWRCTHSGGLGRHPCGRPLLVDGEARTAETERATRGDRWIDRVRAIAYDEHASIAAFARTLTQLAALGAPLMLLRKTTAALSDEIEHARLAFELLDTLDPARAGERPGAFGDALASLGEIHSLRQRVLDDTVVGGAIGESGSALDALNAIDDAPAGALSFFARIAEDETRHAALAFETIAWLAGDDPRMWARVDAKLAEANAPTNLHRVVAPLVAAIRNAARPTADALALA